jgi:hypothetical protein
LCARGSGPALLRGRSSSSLDNMLKRRLIFLFSAGLAFVVAAQVGLGNAQTGISLLKDLRQGLELARALPKGSRPPHPDPDLSRLVGVSRSDVQGVLGLPSYCGHDESFSISEVNCGAASPWQYSWGPPAPEPDSAGPGYVVVTTGGPWLLVVEFSSDRVSAAHWLGQR